MNELIKEYLRGESLIKHDNINIELGKLFKQEYKKRCEEEGVIAFIDFEIFKQSMYAAKNTICYKLISDIQREINKNK